MSFSPVSVSDAVGARASHVSSSTWCSGAVAPDFEVFRGREWESAYPQVLIAYYNSFGVVHASGCGSVHYSGGVAAFGSSSDEGSECRGVGAPRASCGGGGSVCNSERASGGDAASGCFASFGTRGDTVGGVDSGASASVSGVGGGPSVEVVRGKNYRRNQRRREKKKGTGVSVGFAADSVPEWRRGACAVSGEGAVLRDSGSFSLVENRSEVEREAARTLAARRVAENKVAEALAKRKLQVLSDKSRTAVVDRLAAAKYEQRINEARLRAQKSFAASEDSLKSLGSMGSAGELYAKQAVKKSRDDAKTLEYVRRQASLLLEYASPEVRQMVAEMPAPVYDDEFEVFGDCPSDFDDDQRAAYYFDLNRRNTSHGEVTSEVCRHREATAEELERINEELRALSVY